MPELTFGEAKGACHVAYDGEVGDSYQFPDGSTWSVVRTKSSWITGFKAAVISGNGKTVLAFAGTDSLTDVAVDIAQVLGGLPAQYRQALSYTQRIRSIYGDSLILAGHSLGGGLTAYSSVQTKLRAYTVNPAPLIGGLTFSGMFGDNSQITNFVPARGEIVSGSPGRNPGREVTVPSNGNLLTRHSLANVGPTTPLPTGP